MDKKYYDFFFNRNFLNNPKVGCGQLLCYEVEDFDKDTSLLGNSTINKLGRKISKYGTGHLKKIEKKNNFDQPNSLLLVNDITTKREFSEINNNLNHLGYFLKNKKNKFDSNRTNSIGIINTRNFFFKLFLTWQTSKIGGNRIMYKKTKKEDSL